MGGLAKPVVAVAILVLVMLLALDVKSSFAPKSGLASTQSAPILSILKGTVEVQGINDIAWEVATNATSLAPGSRVRTASGSYGVLTYPDGTSTKLEPGTELSVGAPGDTISLKQRSGRTWSSVVKLPDGRPHFTIHTPSATATVRGTSFITEVDTSGATLVQTSEGRVDVAASGREVVVNAGMETRVTPGSPPSEPKATPPPRSLMVVTFDAPVSAVLVDPTGARTGRLPDGSTLDQITRSRSTISEDATRTITIAEPVSGDYSLVLRSSTGQGQFSIKGMNGANRAFEYAGSANTTLGERLVRLQVEVADGMLKNVRVVFATATGAADPGGAAANSKTGQTSTSSALTSPRPNQSSTSGSAASAAAEGEYKFSQWVTVGVIGILAAVLFVAWKRS